MKHVALAAVALVAGGCCELRRDVRVAFGADPGPTPEQVLEAVDRLESCTSDPEALLRSARDLRDAVEDGWCERDPPRDPKWLPRVFIDWGYKLEPEPGGWHTTNRTIVAFTDDEWIIADEVGLLISDVQTDFGLLGPKGRIASADSANPQEFVLLLSVDGRLHVLSPTRSSYYSLP